MLRISDVKLPLNYDEEKLKKLTAKQLNINEVKRYLEEKCAGKPWKELEVITTSIDRAKWTIAVQIALNYLSTKDGNSNFNVEWIDGIRGKRTVN